MKRRHLIEAFVDRWPKWRGWFRRREPVYCLPAEMIDLLTRPEAHFAQKRALLTPEEAAAEHDWRRVCGALGRYIIGIWQDLPVSSFPFSDSVRPSHGTFYGPKVVRADQPAQSRRRELADLLRTFAVEPRDCVYPASKGWTATFGEWDGVFGSCVPAAIEEYKHQTAGCVGELLYDSPASAAFQHDRRCLMELWRRLPRSLQVPIRDLRGDRDVQLLAKPKIARIAGQFSTELERTVVRWALGGFATWDIPIVVPPLLGVQLWQAALLLPPSAVVNYWPPHLHKSPDLDLNQIVRRQQRAHEETWQWVDQIGSEIAKQAGQQQHGRPEFPRFPLIRRGRKDKAAGASEEKALSNSEKVACMALAEIGLRQRYGDRPYFAARLCEAFQGKFRLQLQAVKNLRGRYLRHIPTFSPAQARQFK